VIGNLVARSIALKPERQQIWGDLRAGLADHLPDHAQPDDHRNSERGSMLVVEPEELRAAASRWQLISTGLGEGGAPPVGLVTSWPTAAATNSIHARAAAATGSFQTRIAGNAATSTKAANAFENHETVKASDIKDVMSLATSPLHDVIGIAGSLGSVSSSVAGTIGQLGGQAVSVTTNLTSTLTSALGHGGGPPQPASTLTDHPENSSPSASDDQRPREM
jgi:hypothetical protein